MKIVILQLNDNITIINFDIILYKFYKYIITRELFLRN